MATKTYTFTTIASTSNIGDSTADFNSNYANLNSWIMDFQSLYDSTYAPVIGTYIQYRDQIKNAITAATTLSSEWNSFYTHVEQSSSKWIQPISLFYPDPQLYPFDTVGGMLPVQNWLNNNFPIKNTDESVNYVEKQMAIVSCYVYKYEEQINENNVYQNAQTTCETDAPQVCVTCNTNVASKTVYCHQGAFDCTYTITCKNCQDSKCSYAAPPYTPNESDNTKATSQIEAYINMHFTDRYEDDSIITMVFYVTDCNWLFSNYIRS
jgi:hypothetical protein